MIKNKPPCMVYLEAGLLKEQKAKRIKRVKQPNSNTVPWQGSLKSGNVRKAHSTSRNEDGNAGKT